MCIKSKKPLRQAASYQPGRELNEGNHRLCLQAIPQEPHMKPPISRSDVGQGKRRQTLYLSYRLSWKFCLLCMCYRSQIQDLKQFSDHKSTKQGRVRFFKCFIVFSITLLHLTLALLKTCMLSQNNDQYNLTKHLKSHTQYGLDTTCWVRSSQLGSKHVIMREVEDWKQIQ